MDDLKPKTIIIADDHILFRDTLVMYLCAANPHFKIIVAGDFSELFSILHRKSEKIDLMLVDYSMPSMMSRDAFLKLNKDYNHIPIAMMSGVADLQDIEFIRKIGIKGYIPKTLSASKVLEGIDRLLSGESFYNTNTHLFSLYHDQNNKENFTSRECDVLELLATGVPNKEIANELNLKPVTIKLYIRNILRKLNLKNRTQIALWVSGGIKNEKKYF
jgi:two-component system nitrate/nitrite response regulator NarL